jgi:hypothetical protein
VRAGEVSSCVLGEDEKPLATWRDGMMRGTLNGSVTRHENKANEKNESYQVSLAHEHR